MPDHAPQRSVRAPNSSVRIMTRRWTVGEWTSCCTIRSTRAKSSPRGRTSGTPASTTPWALPSMREPAKLVLFHHDPWRSDAQLDSIVNRWAGASLPVTAAVEWDVLEVWQRVQHVASKCSANLRRAPAVLRGL